MSNKHVTCKKYLGCYINFLIELLMIFKFALTAYCSVLPAWFGMLENWYHILLSHNGNILCTKYQHAMMICQQIIGAVDSTPPPPPGSYRVKNICNGEKKFFFIALEDEIFFFFNIFISFFFVIEKREYFPYGTVVLRGLITGRVSIRMILQ